MKIESYLQSLAGRQDRGGQSPINSLASFNRVLNKMLVQPASGANPAAAATIAGQAQQASAATVLVRRMEGFLTMLEGFRARLAEPAASIKELAGTAEKIQTEGKVLAGCLAGLPAKNELAQALQKTLALASADLTRFRNGTYLSDNARTALGSLAGQG